MVREKLYALNTLGKRVTTNNNSANIKSVNVRKYRLENSVENTDIKSNTNMQIYVDKIISNTTQMYEKSMAEVDIFNTAILNVNLNNSKYKNGDKLLVRSLHNALNNGQVSFNLNKSYIPYQAILNSIDKVSCVDLNNAEYLVEVANRISAVEGLHMAFLENEYRGGLSTITKQLFFLSRPYHEFSNHSIHTRIAHMIHTNATSASKFYDMLIMKHITEDVLLRDKYSILYNKAVHDNNTQLNFENYILHVYKHHRNPCFKNLDSISCFKFGKFKVSKNIIEDETSVGEIQKRISYHTDEVLLDMRSELHLTETSFMKMNIHRERLNDLNLAYAQRMDVQNISEENIDLDASSTSKSINILDNSKFFYKVAKLFKLDKLLFNKDTSTNTYKEIQGIDKISTRRYSHTHYKCDHRTVKYHKHESKVEVYNSKFPSTTKIISTGGNKKFKINTCHNNKILSKVTRKHSSSKHMEDIKQHSRLKKSFSEDYYASDYSYKTNITMGKINMVNATRFPDNINIEIQ